MTALVVLQQGVNLLNIGEPQALLIVGILALLLVAAMKYRNPMAAIAWGISVQILVVASLLDIGLEVFWLAVIGTSTVLLAGLVVRWQHA